MNSVSSSLRVVLSRDSAESEHIVDAVIANNNGILEAFGDSAKTVIPRSAIKPIQVLPLLRTGAADAFSVTETEIALGAASHSAEPRHIAAVDAWLTRIGLDRSALECGADRPISDDEADRMLAAGESFEAIHNCCSGKHTGFLTIAKHLGIDHVGYIHREHPIQELVSEAIAEFTGVDVGQLSSGIDGCGIPTFAVPLESLAGAMARLVTSTDPSAQRVSNALAPNAFWMSGADRQEFAISKVAVEPIISKAGAEGVFMAALPARGIGIALKARDGAHRAAEAAIAATLEHLGAIPPGLSTSEITNKAGTVVGTMQVVLP